MGHTRPFLRAHGLSDQQWRVLRVLGNGEALETGKVAQQAFLLGPSLTGVLSRMERDGLIERQKDPADQRRSVVSAGAGAKRRPAQGAGAGLWQGPARSALPTA